MYMNKYTGTDWCSQYRRKNKINKLVENTTVKLEGVVTMDFNPL